MPNVGRVYFGLRGHFDPDEVTAVVGLEPTATKREGERNPEKRIPKRSMWDVSSEKIQGDTLDIYSLASEVIEILKPYKDAIAEAAKRWNLQAKLQVVLEISTNESIGTPALGFDEHVIKFLSEVGASIDIDTYRN